MTTPELHVVVPGSLEQRTGGYIYDARMVAGLRGLGWHVHVHNLDGRFPDIDERARASLDRTLADLPDGSRVVVDGLAMGGLPEPIRAHRHRVRLLALVHHPLAAETGLDADQRDRFARLERAALAAARGVLVTSEYTAAELTRFGVEPDRVRVARPGTDTAPRATGPAVDAPPQLLCVATLVPRKGHDVLVPALARLGDIGWRCVCAGSLDRAPAYAATIAAAVRDAGLGNRVRLVGECAADALDRLYDGSSVFVLPSHYEGYGMVLTEALARGLPVVATTGGAIPHTVPAAAGILVPPGDDGALADALRALLTEPSGARRRAEMGEAARRHSAGLPGWEQAAMCFAAATLALAPD